MAQLTQNEMKGNCAMPERVGSNEGLGISTRDGRTGSTLLVTDPASAVLTTTTAYFSDFSFLMVSDCSCAGLVALGGAKGGGKPTKQRKTRIGSKA